MRFPSSNISICKKKNGTILTTFVSFYDFLTNDIIRHFNFLGMFVEWLIVAQRPKRTRKENKRCHWAGPSSAKWKWAEKSEEQNFGKNFRKGLLDLSFTLFKWNCISSFGCARCIGKKVNNLALKRWE